MKIKLSLLLAMVLAMTMVIGIGVTAFAAPRPDEYNISVINSNGDEVWAKKETLYTVTTVDDNQQYTVWIVRLYNETNPINEDSNYSFLFADDEGNVYDTGTAVYINTLTMILNQGNLGTTRESVATNVASISNVMFGKNLHLYGWNEYSNPPSSNLSSPAYTHTHNFKWQTITAPTKDADGLEGEVCSCGATRNTQKLSAYAYSLNDYATPMINAAKAGQIITFEFGEWNSFPKAFMEKIATKSMEGITFVFRYKWNHVKQEITIPAGTPIDLNFDWYGPAKMADLYGAN